MTRKSETVPGITPIPVLTVPVTKMVPCPVRYLEP